MAGAAAWCNPGPAKPGPTPAEIEAEARRLSDERAAATMAEQEARLQAERDRRAAAKAQRDSEKADRAARKAADEEAIRAAYVQRMTDALWAVDTRPAPSPDPWEAAEVVRGLI